MSGGPGSGSRLGLLDALAQQAAWWAAVLLAVRGNGALAAAAPLAVVVLHLGLRPQARGRIAATAALAAAFGMATDTLLARSGLLAFAGAAGSSPAWMVALWAAFGAALTASLRSTTRWPLAGLALASAAAGALAYRGGAALDAIAFPLGSLPALAAVAAQWAVGVPLLAAMARESGPGPGWLGRPPAHQAPAP